MEEDCHQTTKATLYDDLWHAMTTVLSSTKWELVVRELKKQEGKEQINEFCEFMRWHVVKYIIELLKSLSSAKPGSGEACVRWQVVYQDMISRCGYHLSNMYKPFLPKC